MLEDGDHTIHHTWVALRLANYMISFILTNFDLNYTFIFCYEVAY